MCDTMVENKVFMKFVSLVLLMSVNCVSWKAQSVVLDCNFLIKGCFVDYSI